MFERFANLAETENAIDDRTELVQRDRAVHRLEHLAAANVDSLHADVLHEDRHDVDGARPGQDADEVDASADANRFQRFVERAGAADLDDVIDAGAAGELAAAVFPIRPPLVLEAV